MVQVAAIGAWGLSVGAGCNLLAGTGVLQYGPSASGANASASTTAVGGAGATADGSGGAASVGGGAGGVADPCASCQSDACQHRTCKSGVCVDGTFDTSCLYPFATYKGISKVFVYTVSPAMTQTEVSFEPWLDNQHFTMHEQLSAEEWCLRTDRVFSWDDDDLLQRDKYDFNKGVHDELPARVWARRFMTLEKEYTSPVMASQRKLASCNVPTQPGDVTSSQTMTSVAVLYRGKSGDWSPYTGGSNNPVQVLRLEEKLLVGDKSDDYWADTSVFYNHPKDGFVVIHRIRTRKEPNNPAQVLWEGRLQAVK